LIAQCNFNEEWFGFYSAGSQCEEILQLRPDVKRVGTPFRMTGKVEIKIRRIRKLFIADFCPTPVHYSNQRYCYPERRPRHCISVEAGAEGSPRSEV